MNKKPLQALLAALLLASATTQGALYPINGGDLNVTISDANPFGVSSTLAGAVPSAVISDANVLINASGRANGDSYASVSHPGSSVVLLNPTAKTEGNPLDSSTVGLASGDWYNLKRDDVGTPELHGYSGGTPITETYQPNSVGSTLSPSKGGSPNGPWTILFADMSSGDGSRSSTLASWSLEVTPVPEPVNVALGVFGGVFVVGAVVRSRRVRARIQRCRAAFVVWVNAV